MKTFKSTDGLLYAFEEDGSQDDLITSDMVPVTDAEAELIRAASRAPLPAITITPRQIRQVLSAAGLRAQVESAIAAGSQDLKDWWEFASSFERNHPALVATARSMGITDSQIDALFEQASTL